MLIDSHTHLYLDNFKDDRSSVIERALQEGVRYMLLPNIDADSVDDLEHLHQQYPNNCLPMMGLHPTSVDADYESFLGKIDEKLASSQYIAVGEIGIDLYWDKSHQEEQLDAFRRQLKMAKKYKLPVSIHTRDAFEMVYQTVKEELTDDLHGVFHCFGGSLKEAGRIADLGFKMGIGGVVTFKKAGLAEIVKDIPLQHLVLETDAPFLTPAPHRGKRNESSYVKHIALKIAEAKGCSFEEVSEISTQNAVAVFNLNN